MEYDAKKLQEQVGQAKAKKIWQDGAVGGQSLTPKQKGFFGLIAGGGKPSRLRE